MGERYIQVWAPDNGRMPFPSIITIWRGETLWAINWRWGTVFPCVPLHFNHWRSFICYGAFRAWVLRGLVTLTFDHLLTEKWLYLSWETCTSNVNFLRFLVTELREAQERQTDRQREATLMPLMNGAGKMVKTDLRSSCSNVKTSQQVDS